MKKLLALSMAAALCVPAFAVAACNNEEEPAAPATSINLISGWETNSDEDSQYTLAPQKDGSLKVTYEKTGSPWQYFKHTLGYDEADIKNMNTLVMEGVYSQCSTSNSEVTLKIEYLGDIAAQEIKFYMDTTTVKTYEWDVSKLNLDKANRLLIFLDGASSQGSGEMTIKKLELTHTPVNEANKIVPAVAATVDPDTAVSSTITDTNKKITGWYGATHSRLGKVYELATEGNKTTVTKLVELDTDWTPLCADVKGAELKNMKSFKLVVNGGAGLQIKVQGDGLLVAEEVSALPNSGYTDIICALDNPANLDENTTYTIQIFFNWDKKHAAGTKASFEIINEYTEFSASPAPVKHDLNTITADNKTVAGWYADEANYTLTVNADKSVTVVKKAACNWNAVKIDVTGAALKDMASFKIVIGGTIKQFKVQCNGFLVASEVNTGNPDNPQPAADENTFICNLVDDIDTTKTYSIELFFAWDDGEFLAASNTYTIKSAEFVAKA